MKEYIYLLLYPRGGASYYRFQRDNDEAARQHAADRRWGPGELYSLGEELGDHDRIHDVEREFLNER